MSNKVIIISNRLPVTIQQDDDDLSFKPSAGGLATGLDSVYKQGNNLWIGWPGVSGLDSEQEQSVKKKLRKDNMAPVLLTAQDIEEYYEGFSNKTIWPLFHYFTEYTLYDKDLWAAYVRVNRKFCDEVLKYAEDGDIIWVHDYQLLLLPMMLREKLPNANIGFFQHIPFPSFEIFRLLPWREEILEGLLGADLIGFHTYDDMRHFLSSVNRILGHGNTMGQIRIYNRIIGVDAFPMGIDYDKFESASRSPETIHKLKKYFSTLSDRKIVLSIDRLDYTKGIKQRLRAFEIFLDENPEYIRKVSLVIIVVPSRVKVDQYQHLKEEIDTLVGRINGRFSRMDWSPIHYFYRSFSFHALSALYSSAEVALVTPLRDGMNLVCKEYIASKLDKRGVLILSEMAGSAKELSEAILINPNDEQQIVKALKQALEMPEDEQIARNEEMQSKLKRYNIHHWVYVFMQQLDAIKQQQQKLNMKLITQNIKQDLLASYQSAQKRILFLDYDGTLKPITANPRHAKPDSDLLFLLNKLAEDPKNDLVIISGRNRISLDNWLGELPISFIAEHGAWLKEKGEEWHMVEVIDQSWKAQFRPMLELYVDRTPGSFIEEKDYSLAWHYRKADTDFGELRARELLNNLNYLMANLDLQTMEGNKVIEIKHRAIHKGKAASKWLAGKDYDFIMAFGDDVTDEDTFAAMPDKAYTIKVGLIASIAQLNIKSSEDVRMLLGQFASI